MQTIRPTSKACTARAVPSTTFAPKIDRTRGALEQLASQEAAIKRQRASLRTAAARRIFAAVHSINEYAANTCSFWADEVVVYISMSNLDTFADAKLASAIAALDSAMGAPAEKYAHDESAYQETRDWIYRPADVVDARTGALVRSPLLPIRVHLCAYEKEEGAACRRVQVGTRTEQVPVYKMVCADTGTPGEIPAPVLPLTLDL